MKLSDTQRVILSQASQRDDRLATPPEHLSAAARQTVAKSLIRHGVVRDEEASAANARNAWQIDGRPRLLRITEDGLRTIGVEPEDEDAARTPGETAPTGGDDPAPHRTAALPAEPARGAPVAQDDGNDTQEDSHDAEGDDRPRHERDGVSDDLIYGPAEEDNGGLHPATPPAALGEEWRSERRVLAVLAANADTGNSEVFDLGRLAAGDGGFGQLSSEQRRDRFVRALMASAAIPIGFTPVFVDGCMFVDGGVRQHVFVTSEAALALAEAEGWEVQRGREPRSGQPLAVVRPSGPPRRAVVLHLLVNNDLRLMRADIRTSLAR